MTRRKWEGWLAIFLIPLGFFVFTPGAGASRETVLALEPAPGDTEQLSCRFSESQIALLEKLNRCDRRRLATLEDIVVPRRWGGEEVVYSPLPERYAPARRHGKVLLVYQPAQVFGAYRRGRLERWGPVSTGARKSRTPTGSFHLNWKSPGRRSSVNRDWFLPWYFNFHNRQGYSFHEYELPGRPASHGCIRLLGRDARWLYEWGEEWRLGPRGWTVERQGTAVLVVGQYDHDEEPLWRASRYLRVGGALDLLDERLGAALAEAFSRKEARDPSGRRFQPAAPAAPADPTAPAGP